MAGGANDVGGGAPARSIGRQRSAVRPIPPQLLSPIPEDPEGERHFAQQSDPGLISYRKWSSGDGDIYRYSVEWRHRSIASDPGTGVRELAAGVARSPQTAAGMRLGAGSATPAAKNPVAVPPSLVARLRHGGVPRRDLLLASDALALGAQLEQILARVPPRSYQDQHQRALPLEVRVLVEPVLRRALEAAGSVSHPRLRSLATEAVRRYVDPRRGSANEAIVELLEAACAARD
ncbi:hypothetical protein GPECTOR_739g898 [Gonium pectorale]|uniref:Uncharacterized protein n=1 Tax=Gonium pectorale TaxID=33097 RepID=A0A150FU89_GONPE|nr:hypothetical protein GPECTOR_739g898 [Gonium pectorale]|eukprot:KXZ41138.1 hypothetical protein GPECTOR_739g898 [Gonium pectorale]